MPITPTYPGVYIEEVPSAVRPITGVATSITAFVGRAKRGPVNEPVTVNSWADFERRFGGLWLHSTLSYAVRDFFLNGGGKAIVVRLFRPWFRDDDHRDAAVEAAQAVADAAQAALDGGGDAAAVAAAARAEADDRQDDTKPLESAAADAVATAAEAAEAAGASAEEVNAAAAEAAAGAVPRVYAELDAGGMPLRAAYPGSWGNELEVTVVHDPEDETLFDLTVVDGASGQTEALRRLSVGAEDPRRVDRVLANESALIRGNGDLPDQRPSEQEDASVQEGGEATDGSALEGSDFEGNSDRKQGIHALDKTDLVNLVCIPPYELDTDVEDGLWATVEQYCVKRRAFLIVDAPRRWTTKDHPLEPDEQGGLGAIAGGMTRTNSAIFFPRVVKPNPSRDGQLETFAACGTVAGAFARTDAQRGVWKAPAGLDTTLVGVTRLSVSLTDAENGDLNQVGVNCLRAMPAAGRVVWGSRTLDGADRRASPWKYVPVRRLALFIEESLYRGTQWVVFEPNDEPLWAQIRLNVGTFMHTLFRQGAFQGTSPQDAYFVKCDSETTIQADIDRGIVNIDVGFRPLKPAEFVVIRIQQMAGQAEA